VNPELDVFLTKAEAVMQGDPNGYDREPVAGSGINPPAWRVDNKMYTGAEVLSPVHVGVDLGTAYTVLTVLDRQMQPLAGEYRFAQVVRDGLVVDFHGAIQLLQALKVRLESRLGLTLTSAATTYPPGIPPAEVQATRHVVEAAGFECQQIIDEPTAANAVLQVENGAVVDVGGGTTGIAILRQGEVIYTADEPTGGTHFSLVVAGALDMSFEAAEAYKRDPQNQAQLFPLVRPVMEKVATIVARHVNGYAVDTLYLVGGTACFPGIDQIIEEVTGIKTFIPAQPLFVTPFGVAMYDS
jgi:ethanolamine utilization protein EutJ